MTEIQQLQCQMAEALKRIERLEEERNGTESTAWQFLVSRPHRWRRQLSVKGRNLTVGQLVSTIAANRYTATQAAEELDLPVSAIQEALTYHSQHRELIEMEAAEERRRLVQRGYPLESKDIPR